MTLIEQLHQVVLVKIRYRLHFLEPFHFEPEMILHWRKELVRGARRSAESGDEDPSVFNAFLNPSPATDIYAQRQFQKPAPPFIIDPASLETKEMAAGDLLSLDVLFPGDGVSHSLIFTRLLIGLGELGFFKGQGRFEVASLSALTHCDGWQPVWHQGDSFDSLPMPLLKLQWLIQSHSCFDSLVFRIVTPARLLKKNRPLFKANFSDIFPFILRRVTSVLYSCCRLELQLDLANLINDAARVSSPGCCFDWTDWRYRDSRQKGEGVGGITGAIPLQTGLADDLLTLLKVAELLNIGKGACYGAGRVVLEPVLTREAING